MENVFVHLASQSRLPQLHRMLAGAVPPAPQADRQDRRAGRGGRARQSTPASWLKMNALTDEPLMQALVRAGQQRREDRPDRARRLHAAGPACRASPTTSACAPSSAASWSIRGSSISAAASDEELLPVQRRLDEPQHAAPRRAGLAGDRPGAAPAHHRRMPGGLPARRPRCLGPAWPTAATSVCKGAGAAGKGHGAQAALMARYAARARHRSEESSWT